MTCAPATAIKQAVGNRHHHQRLAKCLNNALIVEVESSAKAESALVRFRDYTEVSLASRDPPLFLRLLGWPNDFSFDAPTGPIFDFHEVTFLTHRGILRIEPVLQAKTVAVHVA